MSIKKPVKMMDAVSVKGKVIKIEPGAHYEGRTINQYVFFEVAPGKIIYIFDMHAFIQPEWVGKEVSVNLLLFLSRVERIADEIYDICPNPNVPNSTEYHCFSGRITAIDDNHKLLVIDIGVGSVLVDLVDDPPFEKWAFSIGEFVRCCPMRVDL